MANRSRVEGLRPISQPYGTVRINYYEAATGTAFYRNQPVDLDSNGYVIVATAKSNNAILGSAVILSDDAFGPIDSAYSGYIPANPISTNSAGLLKIGVADDPQQYFLMEEDTGGTALTAQARNEGVSFTYLATTGSTVTGLANAVIDRSTVGTGSNQQLQLIKKWDKLDNAFGNNCKWIVRIALHRLDPSIPEAAKSNLV